jgi:hypothetical protein
MFFCLSTISKFCLDIGINSYIYIYLLKLLGFSEDEIAYFIAFVGIFSCIAQVNKTSLDSL